jgi:Mg2+ and Co2+ transporter CorA
MLLLIHIALLIVDPPFGDKVLLRDMKQFPVKDTTVHCTGTSHLPGHTHTDFCPWPENSAAQSIKDAFGASRTSTFDDIVFFWKHACSPDDIARATSNPSSCAIPVKRVAAMAWLVYLEFVIGITSQLETKLWNFEKHFGTAANTQIAELRNLLVHVNRWRRRTWWYLDHVRWNLEAVGKSMSQNQSSQDLTDIDDSLTEEFSTIHRRLCYCRDKMESLLPVVIGAFSLLEAQQRAVETKYLTFLTTLATIFLPLSFSSSLFGMSGDYLPGQRKFGIFWTVSLPLVALVFAVVYMTKYWGSRPRRWNVLSELRRLDLN